MDARQARQFFEEYLDVIYHQRRVDQLGRFYTDDVVTQPPPPGGVQGLAGTKAGVEAWLSLFSDIRVTVDGFVFDREQMATRVTITGTHTGPFMGVPPTGRRVRFCDNPHYQLRDGKIAAYWAVPDMLSLLQQLGVLSAMASQAGGDVQDARAA
jgi:predicted ester cyclase